MMFYFILNNAQADSEHTKRRRIVVTALQVVSWNTEELLVYGVMRSWILKGTTLLNISVFRKAKEWDLGSLLGLCGSNPIINIIASKYGTPRDILDNVDACLFYCTYRTNEQMTFHKFVHEMILDDCGCSGWLCLQNTFTHRKSCIRNRNI